MKIYCLGDSLTAGYGVAPDQNWVNLLNRRGNNEWVGGGISGDTSVGMLTRLQCAVLPQKPDFVIWMGGFNDFLLTGSADLAKASARIASYVLPIWGLPEVYAIAVVM